MYFVFTYRLPVLGQFREAVPYLEDALKQRVLVYTVWLLPFPAKLNLKITMDD
jgi:hypothetical protein